MLNSSVTVFRKHHTYLKSVHIRLQESLAPNFSTQVKIFCNRPKRLQHRIHTLLKRKIHCTRNTKPFICSKIQHLPSLLLSTDELKQFFSSIHNILVCIDEDLCSDSPLIPAECVKLLQLWFINSLGLHCFTLWEEKKI